MLDYVEFTKQPSGTLQKNISRIDPVINIARELEAFKAQVSDMEAGEQVPDILAAIANYKTQIAILEKEVVPEKVSLRVTK